MRPRIRRTRTARSLSTFPDACGPWHRRLLALGDPGPDEMPYRSFALILVVVSTGCARVAPYQRERLAHPTMQLTDPARPAEAHVNAVHEGATGGTVGA